MTTPETPDSRDPTRMTIGEHLEELRWRIVRSLIAIVVACLVCIWPAKYLLSFIARPVVLALRRHGQPDNLLLTSPVELILIYIKVVVIAGVVLAAPYVFYQLWAFVAAGLLPAERRWVTRLAPWSVVLFVTGVAFMYTFVLLISLNFLVGFSDWVPLPSSDPNALESLLLGTPTATAPASQPDLSSLPAVPIFTTDPVGAPAGRLWFNATDGKFKLRSGDEVYALQALRDDHRPIATTHYKVGDYLSFVLIMTIAFGLAFQVPLVVLFLARSGIVPIETFIRYRKVVILLIVIIAGILAPPDLLSHIMLSGPMWLLFELGLILATRSAAGKKRDDFETSPDASARPATAGDDEGRDSASS